MIQTDIGDPSLKLMEPNLPPDSVVFGRTAAMRVLWQKVLRVAGTNVPVLVTGESGTGKEILSKMLHTQSPWSWSAPSAKCW